MNYISNTGNKMQTFLASPDFIESAKVLDYRRLGKQRVEVLQILNTLRYGSRWENHPAVLMWKNYESALCKYGYAICDEWTNRGYIDNTKYKISEHDWYYLNIYTLIEYPLWLGNEDFHRSHRSNLLRKYPEHYRQFWPDERDDLPYTWPVRKGY